MIPRISSNQNDFEIRNQLQKEVEKNTNLWRVNDKLLKMSWVKEDIKGEVKIYIKTKRMAIHYVKTSI